MAAAERRRTFADSCAMRGSFMLRPAALKVLSSESLGALYSQELKRPASFEVISRSNPKAAPTSRDADLFLKLMTFAVIAAPSAP